MESREEILRALREGQKSFLSHDYPSWKGGEALFADSPALKRVSLLDNFRDRVVGLKGECQIFRTVAEASSALLHRLSGKRILTHKGSLIDRLGTWSQELRNILVQGREALEKGIPGPEFAKYDIGVTEAEALVGRTGSVVITASRNGGRRLSVLPEEHIVVATSSQLVPSLEDALMPVAGRAEWSSLSIITGPSRTADIEKILVLGAHGPKRLVVFIVDEQ